MPNHRLDPLGTEEADGDFKGINTVIWIAISILAIVVVATIILSCCQNPDLQNPLS